MFDDIDMPLKAITGACACSFPLLFLVFLLGGILLRTVCSFLGVRQPTLPAAMGMVFFEAVLIVVLAGAIVRVVSPSMSVAANTLGAPGPFPNVDLLWLGAYAFSIVVTMFGAAALYTANMERVGYSRALAIYWVHLLLLLAILFAVCLFIVMLVAFLQGAAGLFR
jgi:hypothetical protein